MRGFVVIFSRFRVIGGLTLVVAAVGGGIGTHVAEAEADVGCAFGGFGAGGKFVVVDAVFGTMRFGREVGHDDVGTCQYAEFAALRVKGAEGRGGGQQHAGMDEADEREEAQGGVDGACGAVGKGGAGSGYEGAYAHHLGLEGADELEVLVERFEGLVGRSDHEAATHLVADGFEVAEATLAVVEGHVGGVQTSVVGAVGSFVAKEVAVGSGVEEALVALSRALAEGEGDGAVGVGVSDGGDDVAHTVVVEPGVFTPLHDEGAETEGVALLATFEYLLLGKAVAADVVLASAYAAVEAVVFAMVGDFDEAAHEYFVAVDALGFGTRALEEVLDERLVFGGEDAGELLEGDIAAGEDLVDDGGCGHLFFDFFGVSRFRVIELSRFR